MITLDPASFVSLVRFTELTMILLRTIRKLVSFRRILKEPRETFGLQQHDMNHQIHYFL